MADWEHKFGEGLRDDSALTWEQAMTVYANAMAEALPARSGIKVALLDLGKVPAKVIEPD